MKRSILTAAVAAMTVFGAAAAGDTITFKNGDKLSGQILDMQAGKIRIKTAVAGELLVNSADVATFSSDGLIDLQLSDGTIVKQQVESVGDGRVAFSGAAGKQEVAIESLKSINPRTTWTGSVVVNGMLNRGNTDSESIGASAAAQRRSEIDRWTLFANYNYGANKTDGVDSTSADNWSLGAKYDYFFNEKLYGFGSLKLEHDRLADLYYRVVPAVGLGYQWQEGPIWNFNTEAGIAYVTEKYDDPDGPDPLGFDDQNQYISARLAYHYDRKLNDKVLFFNNLEYLPSLEDPAGDFLVNADLGLRADITERLFAEFKFEWKYNNNPAEERLKSDLRYLVGVGWKF